MSLRLYTLWACGSSHKQKQPFYMLTCQTDAEINQTRGGCEAIYSSYSVCLCFMYASHAQVNIKNDPITNASHRHIFSKVLLLLWKLFPPLCEFLICIVKFLICHLVIIDRRKWTVHRMSIIMHPFDDKTVMRTVELQMRAVKYFYIALSSSTKRLWWNWTGIYFKL